MKQCTCSSLKAINCICALREDKNSFAYWFYSAPHRIKYLRDHPAYLAAEEAWEESKKRMFEGVIEVQPIGYHSLQLVFRSQTEIENFKAAHGIKEKA